MIDGIGEDRDLSVLVVPTVGAVEAGSDPWAPVRLIDSDGEPVVAVTAFLRELQASGRSCSATQRAYAMDLLRWFRFGWAIDVGWDQATRVEARDFCRWLALRDKPTRAGSGAARRRVVPNVVTGKPGPGPKYAASTRAHSETVLRVFYDFCAMRRSVISPVQRGEMGGISLDPMAYPAPKGNTGTIACQEN